MWRMVMLPIAHQMLPGNAAADHERPLPLVAPVDLARYEAA